MAMSAFKPTLGTRKKGTRQQKITAASVGRYLTADLRPLPDFVILGAQRGGTTSLYEWLVAHPGVTPGRKKEVHYFDQHYDLGERWYRSHFPIKRSGQITGESSPYMLFHPLAPGRAAKDLPVNTRFIVLLRNPVERAISHYWLWQQRNTIERYSLERAIELEPERLASEKEQLLRGEKSPKHLAYSYVSRGEYAPQLRRWFAAVGRDRILILESEKLYADPAASNRVLDWLGLAPHGRPYPASNSADRSEEASPDLMAQLHEHFEPHNRELFELLGYEMWSDQVRPRPTSRHME